MNELIYDYMDWPRIEAIVYGEETSPRDVMGPKITKDGLLIQGFFPDADEVSVICGKDVYPCEKEDEAGYFAAMLPLHKIPQYLFQVKQGEEIKEFPDPYAFPCQITEAQEKAFCAGVLYDAYKILGAHPMKIQGVEGTYFAVWAPNAVSVNVIGEFNNWNGRAHIMHRMPMSGIFELFIPGVEAGTAYKYEIKIKGGKTLYKADPYAFCSQCNSEGASVTADLSNFQWNDQEWIKERSRFEDRKQPVCIYETSLDQWKDKSELTEFLVEENYTHVELHPVMEYLDDITAGYSTYSYYAPSERYGTPQDLNKFIDELHQAGIGVILDWTPAQFPRYESGLERFDGTPLYEIKDPAFAVHPFWGTLLYNYSSPMVKDFLISNACFWLEVYHADGLRMDDVDAMLYLDYGRNPGEWKPNIYGTNENLDAVEFFKHLNSVIKKRVPGTLLIAQEDGLWPQLTESVENDHPGFDYKWSGGWTKDLLTYLSKDPIERKNYHDQLTVSMLYAYCEHYVLTLGSRDVGTLKDFLSRLPGNEEQKIAQVREAYTYMVMHPGCKMTAPDADMPEELKTFVKELNSMYVTHPALYQMDDSYDGFEWIQLMKYDENVIAFLRKTEKPEETILALFNFSAVPYEKYNVGVPFAGKYKEIFNSDDKKYGGSGFVNPRIKTAKKVECDEREYSITLKLPALGASI
ncbi:MAG: 1,4-alpha-glucan branching enzyme, partial [Clostridia bacterium]|nr:1,4-alpha-glucan branching enzyme [Clostridia bacterium]MDY5555935.1 1,4-alpha-glucan branching enzyme [Blautia sp.]